MRKSKDVLTSFLEENYLDKDILVTLLGLTLKISNFQIYKRHDFAFFCSKNRKT